MYAVCTFVVQIYSNGNPTNMVNPITDVRAGVEVKTGGGKFTLFETGLCQPYSIETYPADAMAFLTSYDTHDAQIICCEPDAATLWLIPPRTLQSLIDSIDDKDLVFFAWWQFNRERPKGKEVATWSENVPNFDNDLFGVGSKLRAVLNGTLGSVNIPGLYPRYFYVPGSGDARELVPQVCHSYALSLGLI